MITIVSGLPYSGKTLMLQMLTAGSMPAFGDDDASEQTPGPHPPSEQNSGPPGAIDKRWLAAAEGKACILAPTLLFTLPASHEYRIIFMLRPMDAILDSMVASMQAGADRNPPPEMVRYHWERILHRVQRLLEGPRQLAVCKVDYDELQVSPLLVARQVNAFLGLRLNTQAMANAVSRRDQRHTNVN